jgi:EPS-associated MarR family transcriptional regulator
LGECQCTTVARSEQSFHDQPPISGSQLQEDTNFRVLRMLQDNPDMTQREIAEKLGVSTSGLNYCLNALIDKGNLKVQNFSQSKNKFGYIYVLTPQGIAEKAQLTSMFLRRKMAEFEALRAEIESLHVEANSSAIGGGALILLVGVCNDVYEARLRTLA